MALLVLVGQFEKAVKNRDDKTQKNIFDFYISNSKYVNNWDLVDTSAAHIVGVYLNNRDKKLLYRFAKSKIVWERRIAMISTFHFIRNKDFVDALKIAELLVNDDHDLIHKAVGWMLREIGKRNVSDLIRFLDVFAPKMPRTMLRYAIEKLNPRKRRFYLAK